MSELQPNEPQWERGVLEKVALAAIQEQRSARRWGVFFKMTFLLYLIVVLVIGMGWVGKHDGLPGSHTALIDISLRPGARGVRAHGTPWHGDGGFAAPANAPLGALFFLRHAQATRLRPLSAPEAAARLFARSFPPPWDVEGVEGALDACADAAAAAPAFELGFRPDRSAIEAVRAVVDRSR